jgi:hypothetical protein
MRATNNFRWFVVPDNSVHCGTLCLASTKGQYVVLQQWWENEQYGMLTGTLNDDGTISDVTRVEGAKGEWRDIEIAHEISN